MCLMCCEPLLSATNRTKTNKQKLMCREGESKGTGPTPCPLWHVIGRLGVCISIGISFSRLCDVGRGAATGDAGEEPFSLLCFTSAAGHAG